jgi:BirA family transcriptional regulator, biotin operon repressor / biotin---[acetyl-CoA-carboxylase] ligase
MLPQLARLTLSWLQTNNFEFTHFEQINSTSTWAKENALQNKSPFHLIFADKQIQGRGRGSHLWLSPGQPGDSLLSTWCFRTNQSPQPTLTPRLGLGLYRSLKIFSQDLPLSIKAPNDLYLNSGKLAGLLVEVIDQGSAKEVLIGLGLNVLSSPINLLASKLNQEISENQILENWTPFLSELKKQFEACCSNPNSDLNQNEISELLLALNQYPHLSTPYSRLEPNGTLWQSEKRIPWSEL